MNMHDTPNWPELISTGSQTDLAFYRAMLRRVRYCYDKLSVRLSVRNVEVSRSRLEFFQNKFTIS